MTRLSRSLCAVVGDIIGTTGSHTSLDLLFKSAGAPGEPPALAHHTKWKEWLFRTGQDENIDSLAVLGNILEEFMDTAPNDPEGLRVWKERKTKIESALDENHLRYFRFGRVLPQGVIDIAPEYVPNSIDKLSKPKSVDDVLVTIISGLRRAMHPLTHRRKGVVPLSFKNEYDVQDLLHALIRPWVNDIRAEEFTPSYGGTSTRMDFLLPKYDLVIETKIIRDHNHAKKLTDELIIDKEHYRRHPNCKILWFVIYDQDQFITNAQGVKDAFDGKSIDNSGEIEIRTFIL